MIRSFATCALLLPLALAAAAWAQDEGRGNRGGGEGGWGGRRGGGGGDFLRRMDANGNGMIDPEEAEGRAGGFLRRIAENNPEIDLSKPVPLEKLEQASAAARERWGMSGGGEGRGPGGPPRGDDGGDERRDGNAGSSASSANKPPERLVPGFGEEIASAEVPGFGLMTKALAVVKITDADRQEAQRRFGWFDRNNDGVLDGDEFEQARSRGYDEFDSNKDGKLTIDELAMRYAKRRAEEEAAAKAASVASSSSSSSSTNRRDDDRSRKDGGRTSSSSSARVTKSSNTKTYRIAPADERLAKKGLPSWFLDKDDDGDGQVAMAEYGESWTESSLADFAKYDLNSDGVITPAECLRAGKLSGSSLASSRGSFGSRSGSGSSSSSRPSSGYGSRTEVAKVDPPKTPPMSSSNATSRDNDEDEQDDSAEESGDDEAASAENSATTASAASASGTSDASTESTGSPASSGVTSATIQTGSTTAAPAAVEENVALDPRYLSYAEGRIKQVDANGDGVLQPDEWIKMTKSPASADKNGDQRITPDELGLYYQKQ